MISRRRALKVSEVTCDCECGSVKLPRDSIPSKVVGVTRLFKTRSNQITKTRFLKGFSLVDKKRKNIKLKNGSKISLFNDQDQKHKNTSKNLEYYSDRYKFWEASVHHCSKYISELKFCSEFLFKLFLTPFFRKTNKIQTKCPSLFFNFSLKKITSMNFSRSLSPSSVIKIKSIFIIS
jgi:hypothetical protein